MPPRPLLSLVPFPPLDWWATALDTPSPVLDAEEPFRKMGHRNRYRIATASGPHWLTVPLVGGRDQRTPLPDLEIDSRTPWQRTHWRTIVSAYQRAPFFEHYRDGLELLYDPPWTRLAVFAEATLDWVRSLQLFFVPDEVRSAAASDLIDCRDARPAPAYEMPAYLQVFAERTGFCPNLSILDLLFCEGPESGHYLRHLAKLKKARATRTDL